MATIKRKRALTVEDEQLDPRWATFLDLYLATGNAMQSAKDAGFSDSYANVITTRFPDKVRKSMATVLEANGVTSELIAQKIYQLLHGKRTVYFAGQEFETEVDDYQAIDKGITHALKVGLGGGYAPERSVAVQLKGDIKDFAKYDSIREKYEAELLESYQE